MSSVKQDQIGTNYQFLGTHDQEIGTMKFRDKKIFLIIEGNRYTCDPGPRNKQFEFIDENGKLVLTVDKKTLALKDTYHIVFVEKFPSLVAAIVAIPIDEYFHHGPTN